MNHLSGLYKGSRSSQTVVMLLALAALYLASRYSYLLFHTTAEVFSVVIGFILLALVWNTRHWMNNNYLFLLGVGLACSGGIDLVHTLAYKGMNIFPGYDANLPTQLWIAARYLQSITLLAAPLSLGAQIAPASRPKWEVSVFALYLLITLSLLVVVFAGWFPVCYVEGRGLTPFKIISEYVINGILLGSAVLLWQKREHFEDNLVWTLIAAIGATMLSELMFTFYVGVYDFSNLLGHIFKIIAYYFIYLAIIRTGLQRPYELVFRDLDHQKQRYRLLFENMIEGFSLNEVITDKNGQAIDARILAVNNAYESHTGLKPQDVIGRTLLEVMPHMDTSQIEPYIRVALTGEPLSFEYYSTTQKRHFHTRVFSPQAGQFAMVQEDITERKNAELILNTINAELERRVQERTAEVQNLYLIQTRLTERLELATSSAQMGIWDWDIQNDLLVWDERNYHVFGIKKEDFSGAYEAWLKRVHPDDRALGDESIQKALRGEKEYNIEFRAIWKDGSIRWLKGNGLVICDERARPIRMVGVNYDITERKQAEQKLSETNAALEKALQIKNEFLSAISHELRTPLTGILGMTETLQLPMYGSLTERQVKAVGVIEKSGERLLELVDDILEYTNLQNEEFSPIIGECSLGDVCLSALKTAQTLSARKNQKTSFQMNPEEIILQTDARQVKQFLLHLLKNASKFTSEGGEFGVNVNGNREDHWVAITVWDKGIGIKEEDFPKLFTPFTQLDASLSRQYEGSGLGLALVKQISERLGGNVSVASVFGEGSRFTVTLPWND